MPSAETVVIPAPEHISKSQSIRTINVGLQNFLMKMLQTDASKRVNIETLKEDVWLNSA
jgi:hypothetical protein